MRPLLVLCPTRGRPQEAGETHRSFLETRSDGDTKIVFLVDRDDPCLPIYETLQALPNLEAGPLKLWHGVHPPGMVNALNAAAAEFAPHFRYLAFIGDDNRFRTPGWDRKIVHVLDEAGGGLGYANDLGRPDLPTHVFLSSAIVTELGWMGLPTCDHLYIDNVWKTLGEALNRLFYFPDIIIEHLNPFFGKGVRDAGWERVNSPAMYDHDRSAFVDWLNTVMPTDVERVRVALHA